MQTVQSSPRRRVCQGVETVQVPEALLKIRTVVAVTGLSESSIRRKVAAGTFPVPIKDGKRCTRWIAAKVQDWLRGRGGAMSGGQTPDCGGQRDAEASARIEVSDRNMHSQLAARAFQADCAESLLEHRLDPHIEQLRRRVGSAEAEVSRLREQLERAEWLREYEQAEVLHG